MRKVTIVICVIILLLGLCACNAAKSPAETQPVLENTQSTTIPTTDPHTDPQHTDPLPTQTDPTEPDATETQPTETEPDPNALTEDEIAKLQEIYQLSLQDNGLYAINFYNSALGMEYSDPRDISFSYFFREGDQEEFENSRMTEEEWEFIQSVDSNADVFDWYRISSEDMNRILQMCFGLSLSDMHAVDLEFLHYWEETDCYYKGTTSPAPRAEDLRIIGGKYLEDGTLEVHYTVDRNFGIDRREYIAILKPVEDGYHILSNLEVKE